MAEDRERNSRIYGCGIDESVRHLPLDIISEILSWLPIEYILRCKMVCKSWYNLAKDPHFINLQLHRSVCLPPRVILVPNSSRSLFLLDTNQNRAREILLKNMRPWDLKIMGSCHSFLCMAPGTLPNPVIVCNPIIGEYSILPDLVPDFHYIDHRVGLGYDPLTGKYKAVRMYMDNSEVTRAVIITVGESSWRQIHAPCRVLFWGNVGPVYCDGALYWIIDKLFHSNGNEYILMLDLRNEQFRTITVPANIRRPKYNPNWYDGNLQLLNLAGCITLIEDACRLLHVWRIMSVGGGNFSVHHYTCDMCVRWNVFSRPVLVCMLGEDSFMLEVSKFGLHWERDVVEYFPQKRQYHVLKMQGIPTWFRSICLSPNLASPPAAAV